MSLLLALFVGGMVSTRIGAITDGTTGFFEGALVWVVSILMMVYFASTGVSALAGSAFRMVGGATQAVGSVMHTTGMEQGEVRSALSQTAQRVEQNRDDPTKAAAEAKAGMGELLQEAKASGALEQRRRNCSLGRAVPPGSPFGALVLSLLAAVIGAMSGRRRPQMRDR